VGKITWLKGNQGDTITDDPDFDPIEDALQRCPWCLLVPTGYDEPDIIGPFTSYEEAEIWSQIYPDAVIRTMVSRELEILHRRESEEIEALKRPHN
jgi:hypothetical protein